MNSFVALFLTCLFIAFAFWKERIRAFNFRLSPALVLPFIWYGIAVSRPIGVWLSLWGISVGPSADPTEGSVVDRCVYGALIAGGIYVLTHRREYLGAFVTENRCLLALLAFMAFSVGWSDYFFVSLKRVVMSMGDVVMALVVLTERQPMEAILAILRRGAYFQIPLSIVTVRYFRNIGVDWDWFGKHEEWLGLATSKNRLGQVAAVSALVFIFERMRVGHGKEGRFIDYLYILMSLYLLKGPGTFSATSISVFAIGLLLLLCLNYSRLSIPRTMLVSGIGFAVLSGAVVFVVLHAFVHFSEHSLFGSVIVAIGRDITMTGRTVIWDDVLNIASRRPYLGVGFGGFWIGRLVNIPSNQNMSWVLGQAHSGYLDAYLQLGLAGVFLLSAVIFSSFLRIVRQFSTDFELSQLRMTFFLMIVFLNITEAAFLKGNHNMWFLFLLSALTVTYAEPNFAETLPAVE
jgi:O-antigen ligase